MTVWLWIGFISFIAGLVVLDLGLVSRRPRAISAVEAQASVALWAMAAVLCTVVVHYVYDQDLLGIEQTIGRPKDGASAALQFITAFIVEVSLSLENLAVMALLIAYFKVDLTLRSRLLFLAILTSLMLRAGFILVGAALLDFGWIRWVFSGVLVLACWRLLVMPDETSDLEHKWLVRIARRIPAVPVQRGQALVDRRDTPRGPRTGALAATPLMVAFLATAAADLSLALDSVPAVFAITRDPFIAFASNALAILTMRSLFFALPSIGRIRYMKPALAALMIGFAVKLLLTREYNEIPTAWTLIIVCAIMTVAIGVSLWRTRGELIAAERPPALADAAEAIAVTRKNLRKIVILIVGTAVLIVAIPVGMLPGPGGLVVAAFGLGILATEFIWARRLLKRLKEGGQFMQRTTDTIAAKTPPWVPPLAMVLLGVGVWQLARHGPISPKFVYMTSVGFFLALGYWAYSSISAARRRTRTK
jgi:tellurite resistance protein TerC